ncbi:protease complex subunit PrcB family protein [bacterium]|nr:MAG: protease complex subunit PrcB family protein [bacterium]
MRRLAAAALILTALGMARRPPEKTMDDPAKLAAVDVSPSEWKGHSCGVAEPGARVVGDAAAWGELWKEAFGKEAPPVDFKRFVAVAAFAGARNTGGWSVELLAPEAGSKGLLAPYRVKGPAPGGFVTMAFTAPYAVRLYNRPTGALTPEERK